LPDFGARQRHRRPDLAVVDVVDVRVEFGEHPVALPAQSQHLEQHAAPVFADDDQAAGLAQPGVELTLHGAEREGAEKVQRHDGYGQQQRDGAHGHADRGRSQTAAVVSPCAAPRPVMMMPAPKKPTPGDDIWAATRDGSSQTVPSRTMSEKPNLLISVIKADDGPTMIWVRAPRSCPGWSVPGR
jgi:hypothetical protein